MRQFLTQLGLHPTSGARGGHTALQRQMQALAACRMTFGMSAVPPAISWVVAGFRQRHGFAAMTPPTHSHRLPGQVAPARPRSQRFLASASQPPRSSSLVISPRA